MHFPWATPKTFIRFSVPSFWMLRLSDSQLPRAEVTTVTRTWRHPVISQQSEDGKTATMDFPRLKSMICFMHNNSLFHLPFQQPLHFERLSASLDLGDLQYSAIHLLACLSSLFVTVGVVSYWRIVEAPLFFVWTSCMTSLRNTVGIGYCDRGFVNFAPPFYPRYF